MSCSRRLALLAVLLLWSVPASAAISFDAASGGALFATSWTHTMSAGSGGVLIVAEFDELSTGVDKLTDVTWNTTEHLTKIIDAQTPSDRWVSIWYLLSPSSGTHTIALTTTSSAMKGSAISLLGVGALDVSGSGTATGTTDVTTTLTVATNAWVVSALKESAGATFTWTNATEEAATVASGLHMADSHSALTGSQTTTASSVTSANKALVSASFTVAGAAVATPCHRSLMGVGCEQ